MVNENYENNNDVKSTTNKYLDNLYYLSLVGVTMIGGGVGLSHIMEKPAVWVGSTMIGLGTILYAGSHATINRTKINILEEKIKSLTKKPSDLEKIE